MDVSGEKESACHQPERDTVSNTARSVIFSDASRGRMHRHGMHPPAYHARRVICGHDLGRVGRGGQHPPPRIRLLDVGSFTGGRNVTSMDVYGERESTCHQPERDTVIDTTRGVIVCANKQHPHARAIDPTRGHVFRCPLLLARRWIAHVEDFIPGLEIFTFVNVRPNEDVYQHLLGI